MKKFFYLLFTLIVFTENVFSQTTPCPYPNAAQTQYINQNWMSVTNGGDNYVDKSVFVSPNLFVPKNHRTTLFNSNIWLGGRSPSGELTTTANLYRSSTDMDFFPGILDKNGNATMTAEFNKIWNATRYDINRHLADLADNQKIDNPIASIYAWPGKGNPFFIAYNFFLLPNEIFAPFFDKDNNGVYEPNKGDYPLPEGVDKNNIPEMVTWTVYNDKSGDCPHTSSNGKPLGIEVHQTTWGFNCPNSDLLNNTNFASYKIHHKGTEAVDSTYFGFWSDPDIGCYSDDYIGCSPSQNSYFSYNKDEIDGSVSSNGTVSCPGNSPTWAVGQIPVASITLLNKKLDGFMYFNNGSFGSSDPRTTDPIQPLDYYRYLNSVWKNGTPLTEKNLGLNEDDSTAKVTKYAFPNNPNDTTKWSMRTADKDGKYNSEIRCLSSTKIGKFQPGQIFKIDIAFANNSKKGNTVSQNIDLMYKNIDSLQTIYNQGFKVNCTPKKYCEGNDCVYPGDVDKNGIVDYKDMVLMSSVVTDTGSARIEPLIFAPLNAQNWSKSFSNGINLKHADADGNGAINRTDRNIINNSYYDLKIPSYTKTPDVYATEGPELGLEVTTINVPVVLDAKKLKTNDVMVLKLKLALTDIQALGFQLEMDSNYLKTDAFYYTIINSLSGILKSSKDKNYTIIDIGASSWSKTTVINLKTITLFDFSGRQLSSIYPSRCTKIRFKNLVAFKKDGTKVDLTAKDLEICFEDIVTSAEDETFPNPLQVTPNPFENTLNIKNYKNENLIVTLSDVAGRIVLTQKIMAEENTSINTEALHNGLYLLKCSNGKQSWTSKLVKNH